MGGLFGGSSAADEQEKAQKKADEEQARIEAESRAFQKEQFEKQIARQQPYLDVGTEALSSLASAVPQRGRGVDIPVADIQTGLVREALGQNVPAFVLDQATGDIRATEEQRNLGRLANLVDIGLGGTGDVMQSRVNLGSALGSSLATQQAGAAQTAQALQDIAGQRATAQGRMVQGLAGLPAFAVSSGLWDKASSYLNPVSSTPGYYSTSASDYSNYA